MATKVPRLYSFRFLSLGMDENEVCKEKVNTIDELVARIMNRAVLIKQERQDDLKRATRAFVKL